MDQLALNWLVLELTGSPFYLGMVSLCRAIPILSFTLVGGVLADRFERRKMMMVTQSFAMLLAFLLATLVATGSINIWLIFAIAAARGTMMSFNLPARQTIISDLVPREDLPNAIALNSVTMNLTKIIGPSVAGVLIGAVGVSGCFFINGASFLAVLWTLFQMELPRVERKAADSSVRESLTAGFRYVRSNSTMSLLIVVAVVPTFFGQHYQTMLTVFARDVLEIGSIGLGILTSATSVGAIMGALILASFSNTVPRGLIMLSALIGFGAFLVMFSYSPSPVISTILLLGVGATQVTYNASNNTLLQMGVPDEFRGRVLSTLFINRGLVPLGTALVGSMAAIFGVRLAVASMASIIVLLGITAFAKAPSIRNLR
jgi:MFS family permease